MRLPVSSFVVFPFVVFMSACANINTIDRVTTIKSGPGEATAVHLDIQQRLMIVNEFGYYCSEPSPDALAAYAAALGIGATTNAGEAASAAGGGQGSAASVGLRSQSITLMRDALYRMCEAYVNGAIGPAQIASLLGRSQDLTAVILAVEQLTGAPTADQAALTGTTSADSTATSLANQALLDILVTDQNRKEERLSKANADLTKAKVDLDAASTKLQNARKTRDQINNDANATAREKEDADNEVAFLESERSRAQGTVNSATDRVANAQKALDTAIQRREATEAKQNAAAAAASAGTTSSADFSGHSPHSPLDKQATGEIAKAVEKMVLTVLSKDYTDESCMALITYMPRDFANWGDDQKRHLQTVQTLCTQLITTTINSRITTTAAPDADQDDVARIQAWLDSDDPNNRNALRAWLQQQTPTINVFALLAGNFTELRKKAITHFQMPDLSD